MAQPTIEQMFEQLLEEQSLNRESIRQILEQATQTNRRLDDLTARVESLEIAQELSVFENDEDFAMDNPMIEETLHVPPVEESKEPSAVPTNLLPKSSDSKDEEESSRVPNDISSIIRNAPETPVFTRKGRGTSHVEDRRDSVFVRNLTGKDGDQALKIKYHEKAPPQPEHLSKISYRSILNFLEALLDYEHRYCLLYTSPSPRDS